MTMADEGNISIRTPGAISWSSVAKNLAETSGKAENAVPAKVNQSFKSADGISVIVVDSSAFINGGDKLISSGHKLVSVEEVLREMKDSATRRRMCFMPSDIQVMHPSDDSLTAVTSFARATGDLQSLSHVDLKVLALTYTLEVQAHGTSHLRSKPPPLHVLNVRRLPEPELPGWGSNVPNLEEWEALDNDNKSEISVSTERNTTSRILGLKALNPSDIIAEEASRASFSVDESPKSSKNGSSDVHNEKHRSLNENGNMKLIKNKKNSGSKVVVEGIDASNGVSNYDTENWLPVVRKGNQKKKVVNKHSGGSSMMMQDEQLTKSEESKLVTLNEQVVPDHQAPVTDRGDGNSYEDVGEEESLDIHDIVGVSEKLQNNNISREEFIAPNESENVYDAEESDLTGLERGVEKLDSKRDELYTSSSSDVEDEDKHLTNQALADGSEQSCAIHAFSKSSVACATNDFAMQNVILQMGLRLLTPIGQQVHQLHRWVLKCHACNAVTSDVTKIFCHKCGNGGTLRKISVTVGENGILQLARRQRIITRGTRYSLPLPKGGRDAIAKNPVLREDQIASKLLYSKNKKHNVKQDLNLINVEDFCFEAKEKSLPLRPPVREALAVFRGKRNPNDNHYSRRRK